VVTAVFANLARIAAQARGMAALRTLSLPHPMETRPVEEIERIAASRLDEIHRLLQKHRLRHVMAHKQEVVCVPEVLHVLQRARVEVPNGPIPSGRIDTVCAVTEPS
jgi:hypothetical protein